jgi:predicted transcriptional regulator of viral defense system
MEKHTLRLFENIPYFTLEGFKQATDMESAHGARVLLHRWVQAGHVLTLKKGVYMTSRFYEAHRQDAEFPVAVSAIILPQSYVSLDYVLQEHNLLTDVTYPITCVTPKNTRTIENGIGTFWYRNMRADLYAGFAITDYFGIHCARAGLAKALFDYLYLRPIPISRCAQKIDLAEELRLNLHEMTKTDQDEFAVFAEQSGSKKMLAVLKNFTRHIWRT